MRSWWVSVGVLASLLAGCASPTVDTPTSPLKKAAADGGFFQPECTKYLSEWSGIPVEEFSANEDALEHSVGYEFVANGWNWICMQDFYSRQPIVVDESSPITGLIMQTLDREQVAVLSLRHIDQYVALNPCSSAWAVAVSIIEKGKGEVSENEAILHSTLACSSVDEWWSNLQGYPSVFGVTEYRDRDRWSYLAAVCPEENSAPMCDEARDLDFLNP